MQEKRSTEPEVTLVALGSWNEGFTNVRRWVWDWNGGFRNGREMRRGLEFSNYLRKFPKTRRNPLKGLVIKLPDANPLSAGSIMARSYCYGGGLASGPKCTTQRDTDTERN